MKRSKYKTVIQYLIKTSGKKVSWFSIQLQYKIREYRSSFNDTIIGIKVPGARVRKNLALLLGVKVTDLFELDNTTGEVVAKRMEGLNVEGSTGPSKKVSQKSGTTFQRSTRKIKRGQKDPQIEVDSGGNTRAKQRRQFSGRTRRAN
jgi:hypothetical protein